MKKQLAVAIGLAVSGLLSPLAYAKTTLTVYTALEADQVKDYKEAFEKANPDIDIRWVRESTGIITAKLLSEKNHPQADAVWGLAATSLMILDQQGMLQAYAPKGVDKLSPQFVDKAKPPKWTGMDVWAATICFNTVEAAKKNLPKPESWADLTKPVYKGQIVMPHPASSGTGYLDVSAWLQMMGEKPGWDYMDKLHLNMAQYVHSGSKPCKMAATGEFPIGISFEYRGAELKAQGAPIDLIYPKEGLGWDLEATAIVKGTKNLEAAKKLADFSASLPAMRLYEKNYAVLAMPGVAKQNPYIPADYAKRLSKNNFAWAAKNRDAILQEWSRRYESKAAAKN
ncbi:putative 2-aminoethylphosphonate ABC transporter substrate-binding protein [Chromobacterium subtsugae]|uniref:2-aminoethylphosphonate ABC transporter substrate-binding protein n=3 Tax=Chromobacterium subtsugae TaxID=251747 RepID=A0ABS7FID5_9NEIS|nr:MULTISPECIES: putative 2-aminoethylphosphonate ABC transporter substrate-binding protein [Chromobacterium]KUM04695.1 phosphonate ABC transporter substrate-binding protein [Chromobacterium subtsugae]KZE84676.1 phosphonate ABC transporter substrate-binding protein [Chromobacterium sp. F49]MBW7567501.1 putative 2-aminoethylphosphonate ABC transporter substrate-binding protein [Chromobacterium subtsugae]MBW8289827.1 putative 2-aminoethylphosphonate ABC transporter substrate-binding protein [Chro